MNHRNTRQHDLELQPGWLVEVSKRKPKGELKSKFVKIVYEDPHIVVVEKEIGILSMASAHHTFCVKSVLDDYFHRTHQKCTFVASYITIVAIQAASTKIPDIKP